MADVLPVLLALAAAVLFAVGAQLQNLGLAHIDSRAGAMCSICTSALAYWAVAPFFVDWAWFLHPALLILAGIGLFRPAISANLAILGMRYLGPTLASTLASTSPLFGVLFGIFWLGETLTWPVALGTLGIVGAVVLLSLRRGGRLASGWPLWSLALPVGAAMLRALAHVLTKLGMLYIPSAYFAGLAGFTVSALVTLAVHKVRAEPVAIPWRSAGPWWFVAGGLTHALAALALNTGLKLGQVVVVLPIVAASPIFSLLLGLWLFRRERFTPRLVAAVLVVVAAVVLIALNR